MSEPDIEAIIIADSRFKTCVAECGVDWSAAGSVTLAKLRIKEQFGDRAQLNYIDLPKATDSQRIQELKTIIQGLPLPVLLINDHPRIYGEFDMRRMLDVIQAEMEIEA